MVLRLRCSVLHQTDGAEVTLLCTVPDGWCSGYFALCCTKRMVLRLLCSVMYQTKGAEVTSLYAVPNGVEITLACAVPNGWC